MSSLFVVAMVKDEEDIIGHNLNYLLNQDIDHFIIANNLSIDSTNEILQDLKSQNPNLFTILQDEEVAYYQSAKMNKLIYTAAEMGASHIIPLDADEIWFTHSGKSLGSEIKSMLVDKTYATVFDMVPKNNSFTSNGNPITDICFQEPRVKALPSVAFKFTEGCSIVQGNHDVVMPGSQSEDLLYIKHYQYRSFDQYKNKLRNGKKVYDATDLSYGHGTHWRIGGEMSDDELLNNWNNFVNQPDLIYSPTFI
jgi:hypothetical protein